MDGRAGSDNAPVCLVDLTEARIVMDLKGILAVDYRVARK